MLVALNRVVSVERLADLLWDGQPPAQARRAIHTHVSRLRAVLGVAGADRHGVTLTSVGHGYRLDADPARVDAHRFRTAFAAAVVIRDPDRRLSELRAALAMWRGPALDGAASERLRSRLCNDLDEQRLLGYEEVVRTSLESHRTTSVLPEVAQLTAEYPGRERLVELHMRALHLAGRRTDALDLYHRTRGYLVEELGIEPGTALREAHQRILRDRVDPVTPRANTIEPHVARVPAQLPPCVAPFIGRRPQLDQLDTLLDNDLPQGRGLVVVSGSAGVGKTALAIHWAHRRRDRFPDGQLYVNMLGHAADRPLPPVVALSRFLRAFGVATGELPDDVGEASSLYRSLIAEQRMVVVLDNVLNADQVRPLLPGGRSVAVVTSRETLGPLVAHEGAHHVPVGVLASDEARTLLVRTIGDERTAEELDSVDAVASLCSNLPLALRIVAANLVLRPRLRIADQVTRLLGGDRLGELVVADDPQSAVRVSFDLSYRRLPAPTRRVFRLLGLVPGPDVDVATAATLADGGHDDTARSLRELARAHLVEEGAADRYSLHDLLRCYARERARETDPVSERAAALDRLYRHYRDVSAAPARATWLEAEEANLAAAVHHARTPPQRAYAGEITDNLRGYFWNRVYPAASAGGRGDELRTQVTARLDLASLHWRAGSYSEAARHESAGLDLARRAGWLEAQAAISGHLGITYLRTGDVDRGVAHLCQSLELYDQTAWRLAGVALPRRSRWPVVPVGFAGRDDELRCLTTMLTNIDAPRVAVIQGPPGAGRTTLALAAAHAVADHFLGGTHYVDLHGHFANQARRPEEVIEDLVLSLGTEPGAVPSGLDQRAALCRSRLGDQQALVIVDNAPAVDPWTSLLPESSCSGLVVITTDSVPGNGYAMTLRPSDGTTPSLDTIPEIYRALSADTARMVRLLATHPSATVSTGAAAALAGLPPSAARRALDDLVAARLAVRTDDDRYIVGATIRAYATERCVLEDDAPGRALAVDRVLEWYLRLVYAANHVLAPYRQDPTLDLPRHDTEIPDFDYDEALDWCESELPNVVVAAQLALDRGENVTAWKLAAGSFNYLYRSRRASLWVRLHELGLAGARRAGNRYGEAWVLQNLALAHTLSGQRESARALFQDALAIRQDLGDRVGEAWTLTGIGVSYLAADDFVTAARNFDRAARTFRECGERVGEVVALTRAGDTYRGMHDSGRALASLRKALELAVATDENHGEGLTLLLLAETYRESGRTDDAVTLFQRAMNKHQVD